MPKKDNNTIILLVLVLVLLVEQYTCTITKLSRESFKAGSYSLQRHALITQEDARSTSFFQSQDSHVKFDLSIDSIDKSGNTNEKHYLQVALFHADDLPEVGRLSLTSNSNNYHTSLQLCVNGKLYFSNTNDRILHESIEVKSNEQAVPFHKYYDITKSGVYYLLLANCDTHNRNEDELRVNGRIEFMNPYGHLDAEQFGFLPFYGISCLLYLLMGSIWAVWHLSYCCVKKSDEAQYGANGVVLPIQIWTTIVFILSLIECVLWYIHYFEWNSSVSSSPNSRNFLYSLALLSTLVRRALGRVLVILVAMGYGGWVRTHMSTNRKVILVTFACLYVAASCLSETVKMLSFKMHVVQAFFATLLELPVSLLDAVCVVWVWMELRTVITQLRLRRQIAKLRMYRSFKWLLLLYILVGAFWSVYEIWLVIFEPSLVEQRAIAEAKEKNNMDIVKRIDFSRYMRDKHWATNWTLSAFWNILYMLVLGCLMVLWRPQNNDQRFTVVPGLNANEEWYPAEAATASDVERVSLVQHHHTLNEDKKPKKSKKQKFTIDADLEHELEDFGDENDSDIERKEE
jgi:hypothetical protein